jgi:hypothetical protein
MAARRPQKIGQIAKIKNALGVLPKGILTPSFIEIAPAVTKRALLMDDDDDGRHCTEGELKTCEKVLLMGKSITKSSYSILSLGLPMLTSADHC